MIETWTFVHVDLGIALDEAHGELVRFGWVTPVLSHAQIGPSGAVSLLEALW